METQIELTASEKIDRIESLLLNRVKNLRWYYFQIDLNRANPDELSIRRSLVRDTEVDDFLRRIAVGSNSTGLVFDTPDNDLIQILKILLYYLRNAPDILLNVIHRIFDSNDILNQSDADQGRMGLFNDKDREDRNKKYQKKIRNNFRANPENIVILAEGDSWFEFPKFRFVWNTIKTDVVKDIIDHIIQDDQFAVYSIAAGGDWLSNMLKTGEYIQELPRISPDILLVSGGGNDMVGDRRLATMIRNPRMEGRRQLGAFEEQLIQMRKTIPSFDEARFRNGLGFIADEFFNFLNVAMVQYFLLFKKLIQLEEYKDMCIITQGYDFVIPTAERRGGPFQRFVNKKMDTGRWLFDALAGKGIVDPQDQKDVMYVLIYEFNEMLIQLVQFTEFKNVFHIDCRGVAKEEDWYDELHLNSKKYKEVAETFKLCMRDFRKKQTTKKVYRVNEAFHAGR